MWSRRRGNGVKKVGLDEVLEKSLCHEDGKALEEVVQSNLDDSPQEDFKARLDGLRATWSSGKYPCPWLENWNKMIYNLSSHTNYSVIKAENLR